MTTDVDAVILAAMSRPDVDLAQAAKLLLEGEAALEGNVDELDAKQRLRRAAALYELIRPEHRSPYLTLAGFVRRQVEEDVRAFFKLAEEHGYDGPLYEAVAAELGVTRGTVQNLRNPTRPGPNRRRPDQPS